MPAFSEVWLNAWLARMPLSWLPMKLLFKICCSRSIAESITRFRAGISCCSFYLFRRKSFQSGRICWECERQRYLRCRCTFLLSNACKSCSALFESFGRPPSKCGNWKSSLPRFSANTKRAFLPTQMQRP